MRARTTLLLAAASFCALPLCAQQAPLVLRLPAGARALALGGVYPPGRGDAAALFHHPAFLREGGGAAGGMQWQGADTVLLDVAGAVEWLGGAAALGLRSASYTADCRCLSAQNPPPRVPVSERAATLGLARSLLGLRLGLAASYLEQRWDRERGSGWAVDASLGADAGPLRLGLSAQNLGPALDVGPVAVPTGRRLLLGLAPLAGAQLGPLDVLPALQLAWERGARFAPAAGVELGYWPVVGRTFYLRLGARRPDPALRRRPFTAGAGFAGDRIGIDYALDPLDGGRIAHRVGLRWR